MSLGDCCGSCSRRARACAALTGRLRSDILIVPTALGLPCEMVAGKGPCFRKPLTVDMLDSLPAADAASVHEHLGQMMRTLTVTRHRLGGQVFLAAIAF